MRYPLFSRIFLGLGCLLLLVGMFVRMIFVSWDVASLFYVSSGVVCVAVAVLLDLPGYYHMFQPRNVRRGVRAFGLFIIVVVAVFFLNYFLSDYPAKFDLSPGNKHTLSAFSKEIAKSFPEKVEVIYLQKPGADSRYTDDLVLEQIKAYQDENPRITFMKYNIMAHPELVDRFHLAEAEQAIFLVYKDRHERILKVDEEGITQGLLRLLKGRKTIYFSVGHGESKIDSDKARGLKSLKENIERLFYDVSEINLEGEVLPKDAAGLVIIGQDRQLSEHAGQKVLDYLNAGGRVFLAFDPVNSEDKGDFLKNFGLKMADGVVHDDDNALANVGSFVIAGLIPNLNAHKVLTNMDGESPLIFYVTGALIPTGTATDYTVTTLVQSKGNAVLRTGYLKTDKVIARGAYALFVVAKNAKGGEIFVAADSDMFANQFFDQRGNPILMVNLFNYLSTDEDLIKIKPEFPKANNDFFVPETRINIYGGIMIFGFPTLLFAIGSFIWVRRRWM
jgi:hypothetical protein